MCYYSLSMRRSEYRSAKEGEDVVVSHLDGHGIVRGASDGMAVCVRSGTEMHMAAFKLTSRAEYGYLTSHPWLREFIGKPISGRFAEGNGAEASDSIRIEGVHIPLLYFVQGTTLYLGPKRPTLETKLGVDDPSIVHDHKTDAPAPVRTTVRSLTTVG
jgi:hypothetical protein